jgi:hypothetical protein
MHSLHLTTRTRKQRKQEREFAYDSIVFLQGKERIDSVLLKAMAAPPPQQLGDSQLLLSRLQDARPRRWRFTSLLILSILEVPCDVFAWTFLMPMCIMAFATLPNLKAVSADAMMSAGIWMLLNSIFDTVTRLGCCVLTVLHLRWGRFQAGRTQVRLRHSVLRAIPAAYSQTRTKLAQNCVF